MRVGGQRHVPVALSPERNMLPIAQKAWWSTGPGSTNAENPPPPQLGLDH